MPLFDYGYSYSYSGSGAAGIWMIIVAILAVVGGPILYFTFLNPKNENKFKGFFKWLYEVLTFRKMLLETLLKIIYLVTAVFITLAPFSFINNNFIGAILTIVLGNIFARIVYEFSLILLLIYRNTTDISKKLGKDEVKKEGWNTYNLIKKRERGCPGINKFNLPVAGLCWSRLGLSLNLLIPRHPLVLYVLTTKYTIKILLANFWKVI